MARIPNAPLPPTDPAAAAEALKQEGNEAFKGGDYGLARASTPHPNATCPARSVNPTGLASIRSEVASPVWSPSAYFVQAVTHYTASIAAQPTAVTFANRAMARLKLGQPAEAEADCTQAIALDPRYLKAYQRRSAARRALSRLLPAIEDCEAALRLEPASKARKRWRKAASGCVAHAAQRIALVNLNHPRCRGRCCAKSGRASSATTRPRRSSHQRPSPCRSPSGRSRRPPPHRLSQHPRRPRRQGLQHSATRPSPRPPPPAAPPHQAQENRRRGGAVQRPRRPSLLPPILSRRRRCKEGRAAVTPRPRHART